jgi:predicted AAA+ superfamily ATPase
VRLIMIYPRDLIKNIDAFIKRKEYIAIIGPRQCGKTTFLEILKKHLIENLGVKHEFIITITFEDRRLLVQFEADPISFINSYLPAKLTNKCFMMIDEFQYAVNGGQKLKLIFDTIKGVKIIITGSSSLEIKAKVGKYMVGRITSFFLHPFNFGEFLRVVDNRLANIYKENNEKIQSWLYNGGSFKTKRGVDIFAEEMVKQYEEYCIWGGYPAVVITKDKKVRKKLLIDIYNNYILKDIKTLLELATEKNLYMLTQHLATQIGNILVYQNLSQATGLDYRNLKRHLNVLKETFICQEIKPFFKNRQKELTKNPKIYFIDMGFRNNLVENFNSLDKRNDAGAMVENTVFIRLNAIFQGIEKINFWRTKAGAEVDFIVHRHGDILPIEVKYSNFKTEKVSRSLTSFINSFKPKTAVVLTKDYWGWKKINNTVVHLIPIYYL